MLLHKILSAGGILAVGRLFNILTQFAFNVLLTRMLVKEDVGNYFLIFSIVSLFSVLLSFGAGNVALKSFSEIFNQQVKKSSKELFKAFLLLVTFSSLLTIILFLIFAMSPLSQIVNVEFSPIQMVLVVVWFIAIGFQTILTDIFRAGSHFIKLTITDGLLANICNLSILFSIFIFSSDINIASQEGIKIDQLLSFVVILTFLNTLLSVYLVFKACTHFDQLQNLDKQDNRDKQETSDVQTSIDDADINYSKSDLLMVTKGIAKKAFPSLINKLGLYLTLVADIWLISAYFEKEVVADYNIAAKLAVFLSLFLMIASGFIPAFIGRLKSEGKEVVEMFMRFIATIVFIPTLTLFLVLFIFSEEFIRILFGQSYLTSTAFLSVLLLGHLINVIVGACSSILVMEGLNKQLMKVSLLTGAFSVITSIILLSLGFSSISIAWAFTLGMIVRNLIVYGLANRLCNINTAIYLNPLRFISAYRIVSMKNIN